MTDVNGVHRDRLARLRARHTTFLVDTGSAVRTTGRTLNTTTSTYTDTTSTIYTGAAQLKKQLTDQQVVGDGEQPAARLVLELPYGATGADQLRQGDRFTFTTSVDAALVGRTVTVIGPEHGTSVTVRSYRVEEVTA